jgi:hypothetical protein
MTLIAVALVSGLLVWSPAGIADNPQVALTAADQALARRAVVQRSDFAPGSGWTGGEKKSGSDAIPQCGFDPKQSDLIETGDAESAFHYKVALLQIASGATVYRTARMARLSLARAKPELLGFIRCIVEKSMRTGMRVVSVQPLSFPTIGASGAAYRSVVAITADGTTVRMMTDLVFFVHGRSLLYLIQFAPYAIAREAKDGEGRLASAMIARVDGLVA